MPFFAIKEQTTPLLQKLIIKNWCIIFLLITFFLKLFFVACVVCLKFFYFFIFIIVNWIKLIIQKLIKKRKKNYFDINFNFSNM